MIGKLKGNIDSIGDGWMIVDVGGVGYEVYCPMTLLDGGQSIGGEIELVIEAYLRDDQIKLFGFAGLYDREWFRLLMRVQGVGAKLALGVLGTLSVGELADAIGVKDDQTLLRVPGVGRKVAGRIINELHNKAPTLGYNEPVSDGASGQMAAERSALYNDAMSALGNLGIPASQARVAIIRAIANNANDADSQTIIRSALSQLSG